MEMILGSQKVKIMSAPKYKSHFFTNNKNAVHLDDANVQKLIDEVVKELEKDTNNQLPFSLRATGDTIVFGFKSDGDDITLIVSQNYNEACLINGPQGYEPIDWCEPDEVRMPESYGEYCSPIYKKREPYCCPVCHGRGFVPNGFYNFTGDTIITISALPEQCRTCNGMGMIWNDRYL